MSSAVRDWREGLSVAGRPDESETKGLLRRFGISTPRGVVVGPADALDGRLQEDGSPHPPWVAKVCSSALLHKTEQRGVLLGLDPAHLPEAVRDLRARFPAAPILLEEQVLHDGPEFILGALRDPSLGVAVMAGAGGIHTELYADTAFRLAPCSIEEAKRMLAELTVFPVLDGYRGSRAQAASLAELVSLVGEMALQVGEDLEALDLNPVVSCGGSWIVLDAKLILSPVEGGRS